MILNEIIENKKCKLLNGNGNGIQDKKMKLRMETMKEEECIDDSCEFYKECWKGDKN